MSAYRGRIAPSPSGLMHLGHARTFWIAYQRAVSAGGVLIFRNEDLDPERSRLEFFRAMLEELSWLGIRWQEGPVLSPLGKEVGPHAPYSQSARGEFYLVAWRELMARGDLYPCACSRKELALAASAPHGHGVAEQIYPGTCRRALSASEICEWLERGPAGANWRFRLTDGEPIAFTDNNPGFGEQSFVAGRDLGDFPVWRRDGVPAYQLAVVGDDAAMRVTEVVRGADLLLSTARQILLQRALGLPALEYFHCELVKDADGQRLAKRHDALSLRALRAEGWTPERVLASFST